MLAYWHSMLLRLRPSPLLRAIAVYAPYSRSPRPTQGCIVQHFGKGRSMTGDVTDAVSRWRTRSKSCSSNNSGNCSRSWNAIDKKKYSCIKARAKADGELKQVPVHGHCGCACHSGSSEQNSDNQENRSPTIITSKDLQPGCLPSNQRVK